MGKRGECYRCGAPTSPMDAHCDECRASVSYRPIDDDDEFSAVDSV